MEVNDNKARMHQSWLRRQQLLNKLKAEYLTRETRQRSPVRVQRNTPTDTERDREQDKQQGTARDGQRELMETVILQNAQMHQALMQQLLLQPAHPTRAFYTPAPPQTFFPPVAPPGGLRGPAAAPPTNYPYISLPPIQLRSALVQTRQYEASPVYSERLAARSRRLDASRYTPERRRRVPSLGSKWLKKFRQAVYAVVFCAVLRRRMRLLRTRPLRKTPDEHIVFPIRLREVFRVLLHIYLKPDSQFYAILQHVITSSTNYSLVLEDSISTKEKERIWETLATIVGNLIFQLTEIMPTTGVLGTHRKSGVYRMVQSLHPYPAKYFYDVEMTLLEGSALAGERMVTDGDKAILLSGMFLGRALIAAIILKPVEHGLLRTQPDYITEGNLKMVATLLQLVLRLSYKPAKSSYAPFLKEWTDQVYSDTKMAETYTRLKSTFQYCESLMASWSEEYINRLRNVEFNDNI